MVHFFYTISYMVENRIWLEMICQIYCMKLLSLCYDEYTP